MLWSDWIRKHFPCQKAAKNGRGWHDFEDDWYDGLYPCENGEIKHTIINTGGYVSGDTVFGSLPDGYRVVNVTLVQKIDERRSLICGPVILSSDTIEKIKLCERQISDLYDQMTDLVNQSPEPPAPKPAE